MLPRNDGLEEVDCFVACAPRNDGVEEVDCFVADPPRNDEKKGSQ